MAKIAGRKNAGAWQLFNNWLADQDPDIVAAFEIGLEGLSAIGDFITLANSTYDGYGIPVPDTLKTVTSFCAWISDNGFPLDVWMGKTAYDFYAKDGEGPSATYKKVLEPVLTLAATAIRHLAKTWQFGLRQQGWLKQDTHPPQAQARAKLTKAERIKRIPARREAINAAKAKLVAALAAPAAATA